MIIDVQPVAHVHPVAVERHRLVVDRIRDEERNDLLGVLSAAVVVRRARHHYRHAVRRPVAVGEPVGARLARGVRVAWPQLIGLAAPSLGDAAVHLVGRHLDEAAEVWRLARCVEQHECPMDVGLNERAGRLDRAVHMRLGGEVDDDLRGPHERRGGCGVSDVSLYEAVAGMIVDRREVLAAPGVGQLVERGDAPVGVRVERELDVVAPDEPGPAGDQHLDHR